MIVFFKDYNYQEFKCVIVCDMIGRFLLLQKTSEGYRSVGGIPTPK